MGPSGDSAPIQRKQLLQRGKQPRSGRAATIGTLRYSGANLLLSLYCAPGQAGDAWRQQ
jgi:hypothetical protein